MREIQSVIFSFMMGAVIASCYTLNCIKSELEHINHTLNEMKND